MKHYFCLRAVDITSNTLMRWLMEYSEGQWKLESDSGSIAPHLLQPFETAHGRYEIVALFLSPAAFEAIRERLPEIFAFVEMPAAPARTAKHGFPRLTPNQRESCHLKQMHLSDKEIDARKGHCPGAAKQTFYRLRKHLGVNSTPELLQRLASLKEI